MIDPKKTADNYPSRRESFQKKFANHPLGRFLSLEVKPTRASKKNIPIPRINSPGLDPWSPTEDAPWDRRRATHLLRRTGFGASPVAIDTVLLKDPLQAVDDIIDEAAALPLPTAPFWKDITWPDDDVSEEEYQEWIDNNVQYIYEYIDEWLGRMHEHGLREKMTLFWHNHFVTGVDVYFLAGLAYRYITSLRTEALGNFKDLTQTIGLDSAMLIYLDGNGNSTGEDGKANENYARELLELFTLGRKDQFGTANYTEQDIQEIARALTGYYVNGETLEYTFEPWLFDNTSKTFFGQTGNHGYNDVVNIIFEQRENQIAYFICDKLYRNFVHAAPDPADINTLATTFINNNFEVTPVLRQLFRSKVFWDDQVIGARIKSPLELVIGMLNDIMVIPNVDIFDTLDYVSTVLEQSPLQPPNVAGWPGYREWVSTTSLPIRWRFTELLVLFYINDHGFDPTQVARTTSNPNNPYKLSEELAAHLIQSPLTEEEKSEFVNVLLGTIPDYDWNIDDPMAGERIFALLDFIFRRPEFQLT